MSQPEHNQRAHALLSASKAERWLNCTPSARLEEKWIKKHGKQVSAYADEGTLAHEMAETTLREFIGLIPSDQAWLDLEGLKANPLYKEEMDAYVEVYTNFVENRASDLAEQANMTIREVLSVERLSDFSDVVPEGTGIADAIIFNGTTLEIVDLKYGKGVKVEADHNPQLQLYAWGMLQPLLLAYDIKEVRATIVQPRLDHIVTFVTTPDELDHWVHEVVVPKAQEAWKGKGELTPGDHCRFCQIKPKCAALANLAYEIAQQEFKPGEPDSTITDDQLVDLSIKFRWIEEWMLAAKAYMLQKALEGEHWPGMKLVESRTQRKWTNESAVRAKLQEEGYLEDEYTTVKLKGLGDIEKLVGKKEFPALLGQWVEKSKGEPTLVPESDKREAIPAPGVSSAIFDFDELME